MIKLRTSFIFVMMISQALLSSEQKADIPCVSDLIKEAKNVLNPPDDINLADTQTEEIGDIDSDGKQDKIFTFSRQCGSHNCHWLLFVSNKGCLKFVSKFDGLEVSALKTTHYGYKDIRVYWRIGGCGGHETIHEFDGTKYRPVKNTARGNCS